MNTTELKKLVEAASLTGAQLVNMSVFEFSEAQRLKQQFRQIRPEAILKLLSINAELVEALDELVEIVQHAIDNRSTADMDSFTLQPARAALAKAEGGEL